MSMFRRSIVSLLAFCLFSTIAVPNVMAASYWTRVYTGGPAYGPTQSTVTGTYVTSRQGFKKSATRRRSRVCSSGQTVMGT